MRNGESKKWDALATWIEVFVYLHLAQQRGWKSFKDKKWQRGIDIERLLTLAEANAGLWDVITSPNDVPSQTVVSVGTDLLEYFKRSVAAFLYTDTKMPDITWAPIVAFSHVLRPGDTVLTFNWDTLVGRVLTAMAKPFSLIGGSTQQINVLKLHGSIDGFVGIPPTKEATSVTIPLTDEISRVINYPKFNSVVRNYRARSHPPWALPWRNPGLANCATGVSWMPEVDPVPNNRGGLMTASQRRTLRSLCRAYHTTYRSADYDLSGLGQRLARRSLHHYLRSRFTKR